MKPLIGPFNKLLYSRKFLVLLMDSGISLVAYFVAKYAAPGLEADILKVVMVLQPVMLMVIYGIAVEDAAEKANN